MNSPRPKIFYKPFTASFSKFPVLQLPNGDNVQHGTVVYAVSDRGIVTAFRLNLWNTDLFRSFEWESHEWIRMR